MSAAVSARLRAYLAGHALQISGEQEAGAARVRLQDVLREVSLREAACAGIGKGKGKAPPPIVTKG